MLAPNVMINSITDEVVVGPRAADAARAVVENRPWPERELTPRGKRPRMPLRGWPDTPSEVEELAEIVRRTEPRSVEATWLLWTFCMMARAQHPVRRDWTMWYALRTYSSFASEQAARRRILEDRDGIPDHRDIGRGNPHDPSHFFNDWMEEQIQLHHPSSTNPTAGLIFNRANWLYLPSALAYFTMSNTAMKWTDRYPRGDAPRDKPDDSGSGAAGSSSRNTKRKGNNSSEACTKRFRTLFIELVAIPWNARRIASLWNQRAENAEFPMVERPDVRPTLRRMDERFHVNTGIEDVLSHLLHCGITFDLLDSFYSFGVEYLYHRLQKRDNNHWRDIDQRRLEALRADGGFRLPRPMASIDVWFSGGIQDVLRAASVYWSELIGRRSPSMGTSYSIDRFREPRTIAQRRLQTERHSTTGQSAALALPPPSNVGNGVFWYLGGAAPVRGRVRPRENDALIPVVDSEYLFVNWTVAVPEGSSGDRSGDASMADATAVVSNVASLADQPAPEADTVMQNAPSPVTAVDAAPAADQPATSSADQPADGSAKENSMHLRELPGGDVDMDV
ncbi:hypothetical protein CYLTODRAFT_460376 [Cylindrobasidium torrendii FP15055 ss-10]|uniref:Uncharacterized protein n=1 Tax=Cylindrobasidium torrendii FP15055 ss-10 TaxID=1314674 RepID=A0A0D7ARJ0_9AGAR|nr:hypothetical protein CYLTODRAFT_460376 [Cylindrobasidium torrendii FP15055 ss-10]